MTFLSVLFKQIITEIIPVYNIVYLLVTVKVG
jgi:hypothetical protein